MRNTRTVLGFNLFYHYFSRYHGVFTGRYKTQITGYRAQVTGYRKFNN